MGEKEESDLLLLVRYMGGWVGEKWYLAVVGMDEEEEGGWVSGWGG